MFALRVLNAQLTLNVDGSVKVEHQVSFGLLQPIMIPEWKWDRLTMDFASGLPVAHRKKDLIWVIIDRLKKLANFSSVRTNYSLERLAELYVSGILRLHRVPISIISDRDLRFTFRFWGKLHEALAYRLALPPELEKVHNAFLVLVRRQYRSNRSHVITSNEIELQPHLSYSKESIRNLAYEVK
ncbi:integrase [Gossypium australe]|uniref:Integrase n=1 Tax=Gossypium australe TaxID=47621 RepID=A0A5B6WAE3_9ROSI|nr:integrase [Gossypium australe]